MMDIIFPNNLPIPRQILIIELIASEAWSQMHLSSLTHISSNADFIITIITNIQWLSSQVHHSLSRQRSSGSYSISLSHRSYHQHRYSPCSPGWQALLRQLSQSKTSFIKLTLIVNVMSDSGEKKTVGTTFANFRKEGPQIFQVS